MNKNKIIVVKIGSSVIAPGGKIDPDLIAKIVGDILEVENKNYKVILVSSGALACGLKALGYKRRPQNIHSLMAISSFGQVILMDFFNESFKKRRKKCAQVLLTWDDFDIRERFINVYKTIDKLINMNILPVINENDAVSYEEIRLGDNDCISARVADLFQAKHLIILSDVKGLMQQNKVVGQVNCLNKDIFSLAKKEDKVHTSGGMMTKLEAAKIALAGGVHTTIAYGREKNVVQKIISGQRRGTLFLAQSRKHKARKRWIAFSKKVKGTLVVDDGAREAIINKGKSLLAVGITSYRGNFKQSDKVAVTDKDNNLLGYGISNYDKKDLAENKVFKKEVIHRNDFVKICE